MSSARSENLGQQTALPPINNPIILAAITRAFASLTVAFATLTLSSLNQLPDVVGQRDLAILFEILLKYGALGTVSLALPTMLIWAHWKDREQHYSSERTWTSVAGIILGVVFLVGGFYSAVEIFKACKNFSIS